MSIPGPGGPLPPEQDPHRPGWGQRPPAGWGSPPAGSQNVTEPQDYGRSPFGRSPVGQSPFGQSPSGRQQPGQRHVGERRASGRPPGPQRPWLPVIAGVVGLTVVLTLVRGVLSGDPEVGDCVQAAGSEEFDTVDCDSGDAEFRIVGADEDMTGAAFDATDPNELCGDFPDATSVFWYGADDDSDGAVYCAVGV